MKTLSSVYLLNFKNSLIVMKEYREKNISFEVNNLHD